MGKVKLPEYYLPNNLCELPEKEYYQAYFHGAFNFFCDVLNVSGEQYEDDIPDTECIKNCLEDVGRKLLKAKLRSKKRGHRIADLISINNDLEARVIDLENSLDEAITGIDWWMSEYPESVVSNDYEKLEQFKGLLRGSSSES